MEIETKRGNGTRYFYTCLDSAAACSSQLCISRNQRRRNFVFSFCSFVHHSLSFLFPLPRNFVRGGYCRPETSNGCKFPWARLDLCWPKICILKLSTLSRFNEENALPPVRRRNGWVVLVGSLISRVKIFLTSVFLRIARHVELNEICEKH